MTSTSDCAGGDGVRELLNGEELLPIGRFDYYVGTDWGERYHPFWKLVSQMVFGVHLLAKRLAKSDAEVMKILQGHVDELDGFLQRTTEDFLIIHLDVRTRIQYLSLPLGNLDMFDEMLQDRNFRLSLVAYNDQIENAVDRFTLAITDALKDLRKGKEAMGALWYYLHQLADEGCFGSDSLKAFYRAMMENMEGWIVALSKLRRRGAGLQKALKQLAFAVTEMQHRVGVASRKNVRSLIQMTNKSPGRAKSVKQRLFAKGPTTPASRPMSDKPLPRDPFLKPKTTRPASRKVDNPPTAGTGDTDPNNTKATKRESAMPKIIDRAKPCTPLVGGVDTSDTGATTPRTPGRLTRKLSKPFLTKQSDSEKKTDIPRNRPSTAPARTLKSRTASVEQLKAMWANGRPRTQQSMAISPIRPQQQTSPPPDGSETMKDQISQFLKTDRVVETWETVTNKANFGRTLAKTKDWPSSIFRAKSSGNLRARPGDTGVSGADLERQMSWLQDPGFLNTYSFKQRPEMSPRIHVLSVLMTLDDDLNVTQESEEAPDVGGDAGSIITALPAVPPPTTASVPSVSQVHKMGVLSVGLTGPSTGCYWV